MGELIAWVQSQPVLGFLSLVGTAISAVSAWYYSEKGRKRRDRREEHFERASEDLLQTIKAHIKAELKAGRPDPFPEITKLLIERGWDSK
jgi:hypothetical protein